MLIVWIVVAVAACALSALVAAGVMRARLQREHLVGEIEDPRDTQIRELLIATKVARESAARAVSEQREQADELARALDRIRTLEKTAGNANDDVEKMQGRMESLLGERNQLEEQLARLRRENERLGNRAQELEMELSMGRAGDLLDPTLQAT